MWCKYHSVPSLETILEDKSNGVFSRVKFMEFLSSRHCLEPLEFILDLRRYEEEYEKLDEQGNHEHNKERLVKRWHEIVINYFCHESPKELNIPCEDRQKLLHERGVPSPFELKYVLDIAKELINENGYMAFVQQQLRTSGRGGHANDDKTVETSNYLSPNESSCSLSSSSTSASSSLSNLIEDKISPCSPSPPLTFSSNKLLQNSDVSNTITSSSTTAVCVCSGEICQGCNSQTSVANSVKSHWRKMSMWKWRRNDKPVE